MKIFIFCHGPSTARLAKTTACRVLFLVSMDSQRSKKFDGSHFWALGCLLTASGWLESIRAIMAPPPSSNVIPEPVQNRVKSLHLGQKSQFQKNYHNNFDNLFSIIYGPNFRSIFVILSFKKT